MEQQTLWLFTFDEHHRLR